MVQRVVNVEAKAALKSSIIIQNSDIYWFEDYRLSNNTALKMQIQATTTKNSSHSEKLKTKDSKSTPLRDNIMELAKKEDK